MEVVKLENIRIKIAVLWIFFTVAMSAASILYLWTGEGGAALQKVISGEMTMSSEMALVETLRIYLIPLIMAFLSVTLGDVANRRLNLVVGVVWTFFAIGYLFICPMIHIFDNPPVYQLLISVSAIIVPALISWYAYKWESPS